MSEDAPSVSARALYDRIRRGESLAILDVRDRDEFEEWHVEGRSVTARQVPYVQFVAAKASGDPSSLVPDGLEEPIVAVCGVGEASGETAAMLQDAGIEAENLAGGMDAWANLLVRFEVEADAPGAENVAPELDVVQYERPATGCLSYLVASDGECVLIDPLHAFADEYVADIETRGIDLTLALDTHVHADHLSGIRAIRNLTDADAVLPSGATTRGLEFDAALVEAGETIDVGDASFEVVHTPGHTSEHVALAGEGLLFTGDSLFLDGVGRPDLEDEAAARTHAADIYETIHETLFAYPDETFVLPGHVQPGSVDGDGPYVDSLGAVESGIPITDLEESAFVDRVVTGLPPRPANHEQIIEYNLGRATVDQSALSLELGPNNCAISGE